MNNLLLRGISGTLYVALIVGSLVFTNMAFMFLCMAFGIFAIVELNTLTCGRDGQPTPVCALDALSYLMGGIDNLGYNAVYGAGV